MNKNTVAGIENMTFPEVKKLLDSMSYDQVWNVLNNKFLEISNEYTIAKIKVDKLKHLRNLLKKDYDVNKTLPLTVNNTPQKIVKKTITKKLVKKN